VVTRQLQVERRTGKVRRPKTDVLPLCHEANHNLTCNNVCHALTRRTVFACIRDSSHVQKAKDIQQE